MSKRIEKRRDELLGKEFETNSCGKCFIIDYKGQKDVTVMFYSPVAVVKSRLDNLKNGAVKNPYYPTLFGCGYNGVGEYGHSDRAYTVWKGVIGRSFNSDFKESFPHYKDVTVCEEWLNFQNFATWFYEQGFHNWKDMKGRSYQLDKDVLVKGNKVYSPETCCFVPSEINLLLTSSRATRGAFPIGVQQYQGEKFTANVSKCGKTTFLGYFDTIEGAFQAYKKAKEAYIKEVAERWKGKIDDKVYEALMNWEIGIDT